MRGPRSGPKHPVLSRHDRVVWAIAAQTGCLLQPRGLVTRYDRGRRPDRQNLGDHAGNFFRKIAELKAGLAEQL